MAKNRVAANILMLIFLVGGVFSALTIKKEVFPTFDLDMITITIPYPGATPEEVEKSIVRAVEESIQDSEGVKEIISKAREGSAVVTVELEEGVDRQKVYQDIKQEIDSISTFPLDAEEPRVSINSRDRRVLSIMLYGDVDDLVLREYTEKLRDRLLQKKSISKIEFDSVKSYEIKISFDLEKIKRYGLNLKNIADKISKDAVELSGGTIKSDGGEILLRLNERKDYAKEFENIVLAVSANGSILRLGEVATISDGFDESDIETKYDGKKALNLEVYRTGDNTPIQVSDSVREILEEFKTELPPSLNITINSDMSDVYRQRLELLLKNAFIGLLLVLLALGAFLEFRLAFWVALGIPTSFLGSLLFLPSADVSINMVSMFAFIVALGIVVDDAIIAGENIHEYRQRGMDNLTAAIEGAKDIAVPLSFAILTNIVAFAPLMFIPGLMGKLFGVIPVVITFVFLISWIEALFILPFHLATSKKRTDKEEQSFFYRNQQKIAKGLDRFVETVYRPSLIFFLKHRYLTVAIAVATLVSIMGYVQSGRMGFSMMPKIESDRAVAEATLPVGSTMREALRVEDMLIDAGMRVVESIGEGQIVGQRARIKENVVSVDFYLEHPDVRPVSTEEFNKKWREAAMGIPGLDSLKFRSDVGGPGGSKASIAIELSHTDTEVLESASKLLAEELSLISGLKDIDDGFTPGKKEFVIKLLPLASSLGVSSSDIASQVRHSFFGSEALRQQRGRNEVKVMVRLPEEERSNPYYLYTLEIKTPSGALVPLEKLALIEEGRSYTDITRKNGRRIVSVEANVDPESDTPKVVQRLQSDVLPMLSSAYPGLGVNYGGKQADMQESMGSLISGFAITMLIIYITLALPLQSYSQPLIVMSAIPFGAVGAFLGHMIMGYSLSVISIMGIVALAGVVINDTLVLIDYTNRKRSEGESAFESIVLGGTRRFRPILLTTLTTFVGLAPMIFESSIQAKFMIPMAISLGYGIVFATAISLILIPALYLILEDIKALRIRRV